MGSTRSPSEQSVQPPLRMSSSSGRGERRVDELAVVLAIACVVRDLEEWVIARRAHVQLVAPRRATQDGADPDTRRRSRGSASRLRRGSRTSPPGRRGDDQQGARGAHRRGPGVSLGARPWPSRSVRPTQAPRWPRAPYLGRMLIRAALLSVTAIACTGSPSTPEIVELGQPEESCQPPNYPCTPGSRWSETVCDVMCGGEGFDGRGTCLSYSAVEEVWCLDHPGRLFGGDPRRPCDARGNPTWQTHCVPGFAP